jgi:hypothetical protein
MTADAHDDTTLLHEVGRRRAELRTSMGVLERALASPVGPDASLWVDGLREALRGLGDAFARHVAITEGSDGLYAELVQHSPRLATLVGRLAEEHGEVLRRLEELLRVAEAGEDAACVPEARAAGTELLDVLMRHRQRGADLVFEAFAVDIGGET